MVENRSLDEFAEAQHEIWSAWMRWQFSLCTENDDGSVIIPSEKVDRWFRQMNTKFADLSEEEKDSDRKVVIEYIAPVLFSKTIWTKHVLESLIAATSNEMQVAIDALIVSIKEFGIHVDGETFPPKSKP